MIFRLTFTDNTTYQGASFQGDWVKAPQKLITKLEFEFSNSYVWLSGYSEYIHVYERVAFQTSYVSKLFLMGREENRTCVIMYDFMKKQIFQKYCNIGMEYGGQILQGWKKGKLDNPKFNITRNK